MDQEPKEMFIGYCQDRKGDRLIDPVIYEITSAQDVSFLKRNCSKVKLFLNIFKNKKFSHRYNVNFTPIKRTTCSMTISHKDYYFFTCSLNSKQVY